MAVFIKKGKPKSKSDGGVYVAGIDVSTATGFVLMQAGKEPEEARELTLMKPKNKTPSCRLARCTALHALVSSLLKAKPVKLAVIEGYGYANAGTLALLVELGTAVRWACIDAGVPFIEIAPTSLKKFVASKGDAKKDQMRLAVYKRWGFEDKSDNVIDAYCLAKFGLLYEGLVAPTNNFDREVLTVVKKGNGENDGLR